MNTSLIQIAALMKRRLRGCYSWSRETFIPFLTWHAQRSHIIMIRDGGKVIGFILGRAISAPVDSRSRYSCNDESSLVFVEFCVAVRKGVMPALFKGLKSRFPQATRVMFARRKAGMKLNIYDVDRTIHLAERLA